MRDKVKGAVASALSTGGRGRSLQRHGFIALSQLSRSRFSLIWSMVLEWQHSSLCPQYILHFKIFIVVFSTESSILPCYNFTTRAGKEEENEVGQYFEARLKYLTKFLNSGTNFNEGNLIYMAKKDNQKIALIEVELVSLKDGFPLPLQLPLLPSTASRESTGYEEYILKTSPESQMISNRFYTKED